MMEDGPMTEEQGDKIISLLETILQELEKVANNTSSIEFEVKFELSRIRDAVNGISRK